MREKNGKGFIFINNYERFYSLSAKKGVCLEACGVKLPKMTIPSGTMAIFPVNIDDIRYATAQLLARREGNIYMMQIEGIPTTISLQDGKTLKNVKPRGLEKPVYKNIYLITREEAEHFDLSTDSSSTRQLVNLSTEIAFTKIKEAGHPRIIKKGKAKVAEAPSEEDWKQAAVYTIDLSHLTSREDALLSITYQGDCARLYVDGKLIADNFQYGRPFLYGLWRLPQEVKNLQLYILPMQEGAPIYLPREADKREGEGVKSIKVTLRQ